MELREKLSEFEITKEGKHEYVLISTNRWKKKTVIHYLEDMFNDWVDEVDGSFPLCKLTTPRYMEIRGFQKKRRPFLKNQKYCQSTQW